MIRKICIPVFIFLIVLLNYTALFGHCDTMDGPVIADAEKAIEHKNVNYVLKWVEADNEKEVIEAFDLAMKVRGLNSDAQKVADSYFFETLVRIHRLDEKMSYTGIKPHGTPIDEKIKAADRAIEIGDLSPLDKLVPDKDKPELKERFDKVMALKNFDVNDVKAGREYIHAYVEFFHFAEGEKESHQHGH